MMDMLLAWISGHFSPEARVWTALAPGLLAVVYFALAFAIFSIIAAVRGLPKDAEVEPRGRTVILGFYVRHFFFWAVRPLWLFLLWTRLPPNAISTLAALFGFAAGIAAAAGRFSLAGWIFLASGVFDALDGRVARARGMASPTGSVIDSVLDRYVDAVLIMGLAWYYRGSVVLLAALFALLGGSLVPYVRAKGESLGVPVRGGQMQRPERVVVLGVSLALSPVLEVWLSPTSAHPMHWLAAGALVFVAVGSNITGVTRLATLVRVLAARQVRATNEAATSLRASPSIATPAASPADVRS